MSPDQQPDFFREMRQDLSDWRQWLGRVVVLVYAVAAGLAVVGFTWICEQALNGFGALRHWQPLLPLVWTPMWTAGMAWLSLRFAPGAAGSGIPQVMTVLSASMRPEYRSRFVSLRLSVAKMLLTAGGLFGGLAIGREGPSVQIAAGIMQHARRWLPQRSAINEHGLVVAGGAAGIAAAFNAPLAGVMFAIEELTSRIEQRSSGLIIAAIVLAGLMAVSAFGNNAYFGVIHVPVLGGGYLLPGCLVIIACGLLGGGFARLLFASIVGGRDRFSGYRKKHPVRFAAACGLVIGVLGLASGGTTFGSGYDTTRSLVEGGDSTPFLYVTLRIVATWLAVWSGVPGGIFAPSLAIGAGVGHDVALLTGMHGDSAPLIALGMAAFLAAVTQAPMTSFIIVMEMVDGHTMVLSLMAAALGASLLSRWMSVPLYGALSLVQLRGLPRNPGEPEPASHH